MSGLSCLLGQRAYLPSRCSSHAVFTCANNAHLPSALAVLEGFKQRHSETGKQGILVHLSGTGIFAKVRLGERTLRTLLADSFLLPSQARRRCCT